jgi:hypothetical protein
VATLSAKFFFKKLDSAGQRRLCHLAPFACAREILRFRQREEVADLVHFHGITYHGAFSRTVARRLVDRRCS